jgi:hypothetical protein
MPPKTALYWDAPGRSRQPAAAALHSVADEEELHMRTYVVVTGLFYAALFLAHVLRIMAEGPSVLRGWVFVATSLCSLALLVWSWRVLKGLPPKAQGKPSAD